MKVIDAVWEKRNLGVSTTEIIFDRLDDTAEAERFLKEFQDEYMVLKVPSCRADLTAVVQACHYRYMEDMIHLISDLSDVHRNALQQRIYDSMQVERMKEYDLEELLLEVENGMFDTDRISRDPFFSAAQAGRRYANWIWDEYARGSKFYKMVYKGESASFSVIKDLGNGHFSSPLGGCYRRFRKSGIGSVAKISAEIRAQGGKSMRSSVSSNNPAQLRNLILNGYIPEQITHIFVRHQTV